MSWHYLQGEAVDYWHQSFLDGIPNALLKMMPERVRSYLTDKEMARFKNSQFGMTLKHSMARNGTGQLTSSQVDSPAKTSVNAAQGWGLMGNKAAFGFIWHESFAKYDHNSYSWKTRQCSLIEGLDEFWGNWPQWGWMRDGECSELPQLDVVIIERGFTWLLTPTAQSWKAWTFRNPYALIRKNHADGNLQEQLMRLYQRMITPRCQEILMLWPEGWTDSKPLAMDGFQRWLSEHGEL
jgi:hypothetical protein